MNTSVVLISLLLALAVFVPFFILNSSGKGGAKSISKKIKEIVKEDHLKFDLKEGWGSSFIAIDRSQKILVFAKIVKGEVLIEKIALDQVERSSIQKRLKLEKTSLGNENVLQRLDLEIAFLGHQKEAMVLNFYDVEDSYTEDYEMQRAEKWQTVINEAAKTTAIGIKVA